MEKLITLFGHSYHSKELNEIIESLGIIYPENPFIDYAGNIMNAIASNSSKNVYLGFKGANYAYPVGFGKPKSLCDNDQEEIILMEVTIGANIIDGVLGLRIGDSQEEVLQKVKTKPKEKSISEPSSMSGSVKRYNWIFWMDDYKLQVSFTEDLKINFIRVREYEKREKLKIKLKETIKEQRQNIRPENLKNIGIAGNINFLYKWEIEKKHKEIKNELVKLLNKYVSSIAEHTTKRSAIKIYSETSKLIKTINRLNRGSDFIGTNEREDLCSFIERVVQSTGFEIPSELDITEEYRAW